MPPLYLSLHASLFLRKKPYISTDMFGQHTPGCIRQTAMTPGGSLVRLSPSLVCHSSLHCHSATGTALSNSSRAACMAGRQMFTLVNTYA